ncbi:MAG: hypothetical protein RIB60_10950 [Phycisphaerales bacterium]
MPETPIKPCAICGGECEGKARIKDAKGRYMHRSCAEAKKATGASSSEGKKPRANPYQTAPSGGVMDMLVDDAISAAPEPCANCGKPCPKDAVICVKCGFNNATGKAAKTRVEKSKKDPKSRSASSGPMVSPGLIMGVGLAALALSAVLTIALSPGFLFMYLAVYGVLALASYAGTIFVPLREREIGWAIVNGLGIWILTLYYVYGKSPSDLLKAMYTVALLGGLGCTSLFFATSATLFADLEDADDEPRWADRSSDTVLDAAPEPEPEPTAAPTASVSVGWEAGAFADVIGNPDPTPGFAPSRTARDAARPGEDLESVERALWQAAHWRATSALGDRDADLLLESARTIEDYDADIIDHVRELFSTLTADEREVLFAWVSRGEELDGLGRIEARFAR